MVLICLSTNRMLRKTDQLLHALVKYTHLNIAVSCIIQSACHGVEGGDHHDRITQGSRLAIEDFVYNPLQR